MALVWLQQDSVGNRYELRRAGASLRRDSRLREIRTETGKRAPVGSPAFWM